MFLVNALKCCVEGVVYSLLRSLKFAYVSSGSHDLAGQAFLASFFLSLLLQFLLYFFLSSFTCMTKNLPD